jgi:hypothetical protein
MNADHKLRHRGTRLRERETHPDQHKDRGRVSPPRRCMTPPRSRVTHPQRTARQPHSAGASRAVLPRAGLLVDVKDYGRPEGCRGAAMGRLILHEGRRRAVDPPRSEVDVEAGGLDRGSRAVGVPPRHVRHDAGRILRRDLPGSPASRRCLLRGHAPDRREQQQQRYDQCGQTRPMPAADSSSSSPCFSSPLTGQSCPAYFRNGPTRSAPHRHALSGSHLRRYPRLAQATVAIPHLRYAPRWRRGGLAGLIEPNCTRIHDDVQT